MLYSYFATKTATLNIEQATTSDVIEPFLHPVFEAMQKFRSHTIVIKIRQIVRENGVFKFRLFEPADIWDEVNRLETTKKTSGDLLAHVFRITADPSLSQCWN